MLEDGNDADALADDHRAIYITLVVTSPTAPCKHLHDAVYTCRAAASPGISPHLAYPRGFAQLACLA